MASKDHHAHDAPAVKENPPQKSNPSPNIVDTEKGDHDHEGKAPKAADNVQTRDPSTVEPLLRPTETLPVAPTGRTLSFSGSEGKSLDKEDPVGFARHAESPEEVEKINVYEHSKIPPPGSRHYVAGQPVNEEEYNKTEEEATRLASAGRAQRTEAEQRMKENTPGDPDYHPADPDHRDPKGTGDVEAARKRDEDAKKKETQRA